MNKKGRKKKTGKWGGEIKKNPFIKWRKPTVKDSEDYNFGNEVIYRIGSIDDIDVCYIQKGALMRSNCNVTLWGINNICVMQEFKDTLNAMKGAAGHLSSGLSSDERFKEYFTQWQ